MRVARGHHAGPLHVQFSNPAGLKWTFLPPPDGKTRYLCLNCDDAEPGTFKDRLLVDFDPHARNDDLRAG